MTAANKDIYEKLKLLLQVIEFVGLIYVAVGYSPQGVYFDVFEPNDADAKEEAGEITDAIYQHTELGTSESVNWFDEADGQYYVRTWLA